MGSVERVDDVEWIDVKKGDEGMERNDEIRGTNVEDPNRRNTVTERIARHGTEVLLEITIELPSVKRWLITDQVR